MRPARPAPSLSLFPFLAVLLCVMGSLIFLLLLISTRIRSDVVARALENLAPPVQAAPMAMADEQPLEPIPDPPVAPAKPDPPVDVEIAPDIVPPPPEVAEPDPDDELRRMIAELEAVHARRRQELARQSQAAAALQEKLDAAQAAVTAMDEQLQKLNSRGEQRLAEKTRLGQERKRLLADLIALESQVRQAKVKKPTAGSRFTFVPYDGASGTVRRPILVECTAQGIRFIPEDVVLKPSDLAGFNESFNPLLAGSNALVKYWWTVDGVKSNASADTQPYVLLVVRPSGTVAYYYARKLLSQMKQPYGYELLEDGRELDLPPVDPKAQAMCRQAVEEAIAQRSRVIMDGDSEAEDFNPEFRPPRRLSGGGSGDGIPGSAPGAGLSSGEPGDRALRYRPGVGFEVVEPERDPASDDPFEKAVQQSERGRPGDRRGNGTGVGGGAAGRPGTARPEGDSVVGGPGGAPRKLPDDGHSPLVIRPKSVGPARPGFGNEGDSGSTGDVASGSDPGGTGAGETNPSESDAGGTGPRGDGADGPTFGTPAKPSGSTARNGDSPNGAAPTSDPRIEIGGAGQTESTVAGTPRTGNTQGGTSDRPSGWAGGSGGSGGSSTASGGGAKKPRGASGAAGGASSGSTDGDKQTGEEFDVMPNLQRRDGEARKPGERRFGLYSRRATIGFERPIRMRVEADQLKFGQNQVVKVEAGDSSADVTERLLDAIDQEARTWGKPPDSFYWSPAVKFQVSPGGNQLVERVQGQLKRAGIPSTVEYTFDGPESSGIPQPLPPR